MCLLFCILSVVPVGRFVHAEARRQAENMETAVKESKHERKTVPGAFSAWYIFRLSLVPPNTTASCQHRKIPDNKIDIAALK